MSGRTKILTIIVSIGIAFAIIFFVFHGAKISIVFEEKLAAYDKVNFIVYSPVSFGDDPNPAWPITCNPDITSYPKECEPAHHQWLKSKGIDITGSPNGFLFSDDFSGTWDTGKVITYGSPDGNDINQGLSGNETITINLLNGLSDFVKIKLTTAPAIDYNNLAANVIMKAYDLNGTLVGNVSSTF